LSKLIVLDLARLLKHPANRYGLTLVELEQLEIYLRRYEQKAPAAGADPGGAEGGGVLLDRRSVEEIR
jgi:hypothetical protein